MLEKAKIIDLTKPLEADFSPFRDGAYADPEFLVETWCTVVNQGFWVSQLSLGTQTGTHIDAPAHFRTGGATLDALPLNELIGAYFLVDLGPLLHGESMNYLLSAYANQQILFLTCPPANALLDETQFAGLCALKIRLWVVSGRVQIADEDPYFFHRALADQGIFLIEDIDAEAAAHIPPDGELIALPLRLTGVSGSPCRVVVLRRS